MQLKFLIGQSDAWKVVSHLIYIKKFYCCHWFCFGNHTG